MKICAMYGCETAALRNSRVCFGHINQKVILHPEVDLLIDRGATTITVANKTESEILFQAAVYLGGNPPGDYIRHLIASTVIDGDLMEASGPWFGDMKTRAEKYGK